MHIIEGTHGILAPIQEARWQGCSIGFVPTMGNLHAAHISLMERAREIAGFTVASIFVNPFQFGQDEDYGSYPRTLEADIAKLEAIGTDLLFLPAVGDLYPEGLDRVTRVEVPELDRILCGAFRPDLFRGVTTVVSMLFHLVGPDYAVFGEKDYQQTTIIRRMVSDLKMPVEIIMGPTGRETDGLAMSSRNRYLLPQERQRAPVLYRALCEARDSLAGDDTDLAAIRARGMETLKAADLKPDYFEIRRASDLAPPGPDDLGNGGQNLRVLAAAWLGKARLIDNVGV